VNRSVSDQLRLLLAVTAVVGLTAVGMSEGWAQQKGQSLKKGLIGSWTLVSANNAQKDGAKVDRWGANPKGSLMFDANGRYIFVISRSDIPKFAAKTVNEGTAEENKAVVKGLIVHFGKYSVNETDKTLITHIEASSFPNIVGADQKRIISSLTADELRYDNPASTSGATSKVVWKRAK
jgi:hypothetical protein